MLLVLGSLTVCRSSLTPWWHARSRFLSQIICTYKFGAFEVWSRPLSKHCLLNNKLGKHEICGTLKNPKLRSVLDTFPAKSYRSVHRNSLIFSFVSIWNSNFELKQKFLLKRTLSEIWMFLTSKQVERLKVEIVQVAILRVDTSSPHVNFTVQSH